MTAFTMLADLPADLPAGQTRRVPIATIGDYTDRRYGDFSITADQAARWNENLRTLLGGEVAVDLDHSSDTGKGTEAAAWLRDVQVDGDKVTAELEYTALGADAVRDKRYRFFSPTYHDVWSDEQGKAHEDVLIGGAFTNRPKLRQRMPALTLSEAAADEFPVDWATLLDGDFEKKHPRGGGGRWKGDGGGVMDDIKYSLARMPVSHDADEQTKATHHALRKELGMDPDIHRHGLEADQLKHGTHRTSKKRLADGPDAQRRIVAGVTALTSHIAKALALDTGADEATVLAALPEGAVILSSDDHTALKADADAGRKAAADALKARLDGAVTKALTDARMAPAEEDGVRALAADGDHLDPARVDAVVTMLDARAQIVPTVPKGSTGDAPDEVPDTVDTDRQHLHERALTLSDEKKIPYEQAAMQAAQEA